MNKENLASMLTRIHFCNIKQLEDKNEWNNMKKKLHVSPFWDMNHNYEWVFSSPKENLSV